MGRKGGIVMFYVSRLKGKMIGVIGTDDDVEDFLTPTDVLLAERELSG